MSTDARLAALEALARESQEKVEELNHKNWLLSNQNIKTQEELAKLEEDVRNVYPDFDTRRTNHSNFQANPSPPLHDPSVARDVSHARPQLLERPPPGPLWTPFYMTARDAPRLYLEFVIPGSKGETLEIAVNNVDLAFILQQTLRRRGWGEATTKRGVEDFLEQPMMKVTWTGGEGAFGNLK
ncbi:hypothetical protein J4E81_003320 [Alternaria sp. BMP 2799]|nr:hypothetical protein J4E81_003320 [Alternaria sp. BMP 2799]